MRRSVRSCIDRNFAIIYFFIFLIIVKVYYVATLCTITNFSIVIYFRFLTFINVPNIELSIIKISLCLITNFVFICRKCAFYFSVKFN